MIESENEVPRPLTTDEIKEGLVFKISAAILEKLNSSCKLFGRSYPMFRAEVRVKLLLDNFDNFGDEDNHSLIVAEGEPGPDAKELMVDFNIAEMPPNAFRKETQQPITVAAKQADGKVAERKVKYAPRRK